MMSFKAVVGLSVLSQVLALPQFYSTRKQGCKIPDQAFGGHSAPVVDGTIAFTVTDADGAQVTEWEASGEYALAVSSYEGAPATNIWIHSTDGTLEGEGYTAAACGEAVFSGNAAATHEVSWTAPAAGDCVTVSVAQAADPGSGYNTNTVELCAAAAAATPAAPMAAAPMPAAGAPAVAPEPVEAEMEEEEGEVEEAVEAGTEGAEEAAEGAAETVEDTSSAAGVAGAVAAVVAAAVAVLAA